MGWKEQFGEGYEVPRFIQWLVDTQMLSDLSYGNDVAPSFGIYDEDTETWIRLWVEHPLRSARERDEEERFSVTWNDPDTDFEHNYHDLEAAVIMLYQRIKQYLENRPGGLDPDEALQDPEEFVWELKEAHRTGRERGKDWVPLAWRIRR